MTQTISNNLSTKFLVPYVIALRDSPEADIKTGWESAFGLYNPSSQAQNYVFKYFDDSGTLITQATSGAGGTSVPSKKESL